MKNVVTPLLKKKQSTVSFGQFVKPVQDCISRYVRCDRAIESRIRGEIGELVTQDQ